MGKPWYLGCEIVGGGGGGGGIVVDGSLGLKPGFGGMKPHISTQPHVQNPRDGSFRLDLIIQSKSGFESQVK